jgi:dihydrofolate reductase
MTPPLALVVAASSNNVIGKDGTLPWRIPADMKRFKALTLGHPSIMGRKTWDSLPKKPLPGRTNIVVTRNRDFAAEGARVAHSLEEALAVAKEENPSAIMVIGGEALYREALQVADVIHLTRVEGAFEGDAFFPALGPEWRETASEGPYEEGVLRYRFVTLERAV